jgi:nucleoside-diphosphate-sugar epimerase
MAMPARVLITGAMGFVGGNLARHLARNPRVRVVGAVNHRAPHDCGDIIEWIYPGQLGADSDWSDALAAVDVVIHAAARVHVMRGARKAGAEFYRVNTEGTLRLAEQASQAGVRRFVFLSTVAVYGLNRSEEPITEHTPLRSQTDYASSKRLAEQGLARFADAMEVVVVRPPVVYGPGAPGNVARLAALVEKGVPLPFAGTENRRSLIGIANLVDVLTLCIDSPAAAGQTLLVSDGEDLSTEQLVKLLAEGLGRKPKLFPVPANVARAAARVVGASQYFDKLYGSLTVDISRTRARLGWDPPVRAAVGLATAARALVAAGKTKRSATHPWPKR